jgi:hypothetical protein
VNICYLSEGSHDTLSSTNVSELQFVNYGVFQHSVTFTSDIFLFVQRAVTIGPIDNQRVI